MHNEPTIYIPLTLLAAFGFAAAAVLQQDQAAKLPQGHARSSPILVQLLSRPLWLAGLLAYLVAYALQMVAVSLGPVVVIQPLISAQLVFALLLGVVFLHREATVREWLGAVAVTIGIAVFIVATDPSPGNPKASGRAWIVSAGAVGGLLTIAVMLGWRSTGSARSTWYGAASGLAWGMMIAFMKTVTHGASGAASGETLGHLLAEPYVYGLVLAAVVGFLFLQRAFQAGSLTNALVTYTVVEIIVAVVLGVLLFGERPHDDWVSLLFTCISSVVMVTGIIVLAR